MNPEPDPLMLPPQFYAAKDQVKRFLSVAGKRGALLESEVELRQVRQRLPTGLVPFMTIEESSWPDIYAFDSSTSCASVVVWSDHAIVMRWDSFESFLQWTHDVG